MAIVLAPYGGGTLIGSIGSTTFQRGRYGNLARQRVSPVNPNTTRQVNTRAALGYLSGIWSTVLTQSERDNWNAYAATTPWLPSVKLITGQSAFIAVNWIPVYVYGAGNEITVAPATPLMEGHNILTLRGVASAGLVLIDAINPVGEAEDTWVAEISMVVGEGRLFWKGPFQFQTNYVGNASLPITLHDFATPVAAGLRVWVKSRKYNAERNKVSPVVIQQVTFA